MQFYKVTYNQRSFVASYVQIEDTIFRVRFGGIKQRDCLTIHIYPNEKYCCLVDAFHHKDCSIDNELPKKDGTVDMILAAVQLCKHLHPSLQYMTLQDESVIKCKNGKQLPLPDVYMLLYGQTWYQKHLGATPEDKKTEIALVSEYLKGKPNLIWKEIWDDYLSRGFKHEDELRLYDIYNTSDSWHMFFNRIRDDNCSTWQEWVWLLMKRFTRVYTITGTIWRISLKGVKVIASFDEIEEPPKHIMRPTYRGRRLFGGRSRMK